MTVIHTLQVTGDFADGRIHGIWLLDVEAVTGSIVSGTTDSDVHMWINTVTGEARLYTGLGSLEGVADGIGTSRRSAAAEIADRNNARYWANETHRLGEAKSGRPSGVNLAARATRRMSDPIVSTITPRERS